MSNRMAPTTTTSTTTEVRHAGALCGLYCSARQNSTIRREKTDRIVVYDGFDYE